MTPPDHIGKYVDLNLVGFGTYGSVYKAWDPDLDRYVAIKVMNAQFSQDEGSLARFQDEARFMARVDQHPNVVRVIELGEEERGLYMVMDYYSNGNLENLIRSEGHLSTERTVGFALQIAAGLSAAHDAGIVHRDIKPQNVLLDDDFVCKVSDFGVSASTDRSIYTAVGTPAYMPPEQKLGRRTDARADIYALGVTMYQMLTGVIPDELIQTEVPPDPRGQNPEIPERIVEIIFKAIELDADSRYPTIRDLIDDLNSYEEAEDGGQGTDRQTSVRSSPNASENGLGNISRRTLALASMAAVGAIAVVVAIAAIAISSGGDGDRSSTGMAVGTAGGGLDRISHTIESLASTTVEIPSKTVKVFVLEGSAPLNTTLIIEEVLPESLPSLPPGLMPTQRSFEVSLVSDSGVDVSLSGQIMVGVTFEDTDVAAVQGDSSKVVIGHFEEAAAEWVELSTGVDWDTRTAWAYVDSLSPFALLLRVDPSNIPGTSLGLVSADPQEEPTVVPTATPSPVPTLTTVPATPTPLPTYTPYPTYTPEPTAVPTPEPTPTPIPTATPVPVVDDHGNNVFSATITELNPDFDWFAKYSVLQIIGDLETPDDIDYFSFEAYGGGELFIFTPRFLPFATDTGGGTPKIALYGASWFTPLATIGLFEEDIRYTPGSPGIIYLAVSNSNPGYTGKYRVVVDRTSTSARPNFASPLEPLLSVAATPTPTPAPTATPTPVLFSTAVPTPAVTPLPAPTATPGPTPDSITTPTPTQQYTQGVTGSS